MAVGAVENALNFLFASGIGPSFMTQIYSHVL